MRNHVEAFTDNYYSVLEDKINGYCRSLKCNPISISVIRSGGTYVAFVVVEEDNE